LPNDQKQQHYQRSSYQRTHLYRAMAISTVFVLYLKFLLPETATLFYELYHLLHIDALYWIYSGFKVVAIYFNQWPAQNLALGLLWLLLSLFSYWKHERRIVNITKTAQSANSIKTAQSANSIKSAKP
jgi:hypothetical protein